MVFRSERPPYWIPKFDRWNLLIAILLLLAFVVATLRGCGAPQPTQIIPTITRPGWEATLDYAAPGTIVGQVAPGVSVRIFDSDQLLGETTADQSGFFRFSLPTLAVGPHSLTARVYDASDKLLGSSAPVAVSVSGGPAAKASPPAGAAMATLTVQPPVFTGLAPGTQLVSGMPVTLTGTAASGTKVRLFANDLPIGETSAGADARWSLSAPGLAVGAYTLIARSYGPDGALLTESAPLRVTVVEAAAVARLTPAAVLTATVVSTRTLASVTGTVTPTLAGTPKPPPAVPITLTVAAPTAVATPLPLPTATPRSAPTTGAVAPAPPVNGDTVTMAAGAPVFLSGTAAPGTILRIYDGERLLDEVVVGIDGQWHLDLGPLVAGLHVFTARAFDADGKILSTSAPLNLMVAPAGAGVPSAVGTPGVTPEVTTPKPGAVLDASSPGYLEGKAAPGATVRIYDGVKLLAEVTAGPDGAWRVVLPLLAAGAHTFQVRVAGLVGSEGATSTPLTVTIRSVPTTAAVAPGPAGTKPLVTGLISGNILRSSQPLLTGSAQPNRVVRIYDGAFLLGETQANAQGIWHFVPLTPLAIGKHVLRVAFVGADGEEVYGDPVEITIAEDATGLKLPVFLPPVPKGPSPIGLLQGTAPPGTQVSIYDGSTLLGAVQAGPDGKWVYSLPTRTQAGVHQFSIAATSPDGVIVYRSAPTDVLVKAGGSE